MHQIAAIIISPFCDNDCVFCGNHPRVDPEELLTIESLVNINIEHHLSYGARNIEISGADPGEYDNLPNLIRNLKAKGVESVRLSTNGFRCADPVWVDKLVTAGLDSVKIPLYGPTAVIHESVARKSGCFDAAVQALNLFKDRGIEIVINSLIMTQNREHLIDLYRLMLTITDWKHCFFSIPCLVGYSPSFYLPIKDLRHDCIPLIYFGSMTESFPIFTELPLCVFGFEYPFINRGGTPKQGLQQPPPQFRSHLEDVPSYRIKRKPLICADCRLANTCEGFFLNDLEQYGTGDLKPFV